MYYTIKIEKFKKLENIKTFQNYVNKINLVWLKINFI